ncbi:MAG: SIMPL domain-containing protein, partial [Bacteroidia bacterium]|nr:SIMPL domain-containing protein [Bacteroidia bacterium]
MKQNLTAIIFGLAIVGSSFILGNAVINRNKQAGTIAVTGLGQTNFTSDLIVWEARFTRVDRDLKQAYADLERDKKAIQDYLKAKGILDSVVVFNAVS